MTLSISRFTLAIAAIAVLASSSPPRRPSIPPRPCTGARSARRAPAARAPSPACRASRTSFYIGFDNGGVWRSTDYGSNWEPIFDNEPTGSIGAIAVAPSDPNIIYVGTGAGIIRPDLAIGDGMYKSTDAGKTWTHLGLRDSQMIAQIDVDPKNPNRLFVAALGHPYGPNAERGMFRSTDGGQTFQKVLYKDEYTSGNDVRIDPTDPQHRLRGAVAAAAELHRRRRVRRRAANGIFKSTDGGTTWKQLTDGLPAVIASQPRDRAEQSEDHVCDGRGGRLAAAAAAGAAGRRGGGGGVGFYKSIGRRRALASSPSNDPSAPGGAQARVQDKRPLVAHRRRRSADDRRRSEE